MKAQGLGCENIFPHPMARPGPFLPTDPPGYPPGGHPALSRHRSGHTGSQLGPPSRLWASTRSLCGLEAPGRPGASRPSGATEPPGYPPGGYPAAPRDHISVENSTKLDPACPARQQMGREWHQYAAHQVSEPCASPCRPCTSVSGVTREVAAASGAASTTCMLLGEQPGAVAAPQSTSVAEDAVVAGCLAAAGTKAACARQQPGAAAAPWLAYAAVRTGPRRTPSLPAPRLAAGADATTAGQLWPGFTKASQAAMRDPVQQLVSL